MNGHLEGVPQPDPYGTKPNNGYCTNHSLTGPSPQETKTTGPTGPNTLQTHGIFREMFERIGQTISPLPQKLYLESFFADSHTTNLDFLKVVGKNIFPKWW